VPLLALGALFGLSERLLDHMVEKTEELWEKQEKKPEEGPPGETPEEIVRRMQLRLETEEQEKDGPRVTRRMTLDVLQGPGKAGPSEAPRDREEPGSPTTASPSPPPSEPPKSPRDAIPTR
jgi:hypothetical protein